MTPNGIDLSFVFYLNLDTASSLSLRRVMFRIKCLIISIPLQN